VLSSGIWRRRVVFVRADASEEHIFSIFSVKDTWATLEPSIASHRGQQCKMWCFHGGNTEEYVFWDMMPSGSCKSRYFRGHISPTPSAFMSVSGYSEFRCENKYIRLSLPYEQLTFREKQLGSGTDISEVLGSHGNEYKYFAFGIRYPDAYSRTESCNIRIQT
jgi:hypothetical protein